MPVTYPTLLPLLKSKQLYLLLFAWLLVQSLLYMQYGIKPILESLKYIKAGHYLAEHGRLAESRYLFYFSTTFLIAVCTKLGLGFGGVVVFQLLLNALATFQFYKALQFVQTKAWSAFAATLLLIFCLPYQTWNFYLYTESLFYSFILLFFSHCIRSKTLTASNVLAQLLLLLVVIISRPLGILFLPVWVVYLISKAGRRWRPLLVAASVASGAVFVLVSNFILGHIADWSMLTSAENNEIICDVPVGAPLALDALKNKPPVTQLLSYLYAYPRHFAGLAAERLYRFFFLVRPYYSALHNGFLLLLCGLLYLPILANFLFSQKKRLQHPIAFPISAILFFSASIALQCDDWHNRFLLALVPLFLYCGVFLLLEKFFGNRSV